MNKQQHLTCAQGHIQSALGLIAVDSLKQEPCGVLHEGICKTKSTYCINPVSGCVSCPDYQEPICKTNGCEKSIVDNTEYCREHLNYINGFDESLSEPESQEPEGGPLNITNSYHCEQCDTKHPNGYVCQEPVSEFVAKIKKRYLSVLKAGNSVTRFLDIQELCDRLEAETKEKERLKDNAMKTIIEIEGELLIDIPDPVYSLSVLAVTQCDEIKQLTKRAEDAEKEVKTLADGITKVNNTCVKIRRELEVKLDKANRKHEIYKTNTKDICDKLEAKLKTVEEYAEHKRDCLRRPPKTVKEWTVNDCTCGLGKKGDSNEATAAKIYDKKAIELFGKDAYVNFQGE